MAKDNYWKHYGGQCHHQSSYFEEISPLPVVVLDLATFLPILPDDANYGDDDDDDCQPLCQALIPDGQAEQPKGGLRAQEPAFSTPALHLMIIVLQY